MNSVARTTADRPSVSVVVPVFNSAATLPALVSRLNPVLAAQAGFAEILLVNDGSRDGSWEVIRALAAEHAHVCGLNLMRNFGQHNALLCGTRNARGDVIVTMDDDLQHPPEEVPTLLDKLAEGFDVVYGVPRALPHSSARNLLSAVSKRLLARVMGQPRIRDISAFRTFRTQLRDAFAGCHGPYLLLDVLLSWGTTRFATVAVDLHPRAAGLSNYTFRKLLRQALLILTGFSTAPLRFASLVGLAFTLFGFAVFVYVLYVYFAHGSVPGFPFLASIIALFSGAQMFALGVIGEYLARVIERSMERPTYVVAERTTPDPDRST